MHAANSAVPQTAVRRPVSYSTILWIGLVAGTLDISDNLIYNAMRGVTPAMVFRFIASGLVGTRVVQMGWVAVALGLVLHYFIALSWTVIFYAASRKIAVLWRRPVISGLLYGCVVYALMNYIVVPLSSVPHLTRHISVAARVNAVLAILLCIGLTISLLTRRYASPMAKSQEAGAA